MSKENLTNICDPDVEKKLLEARCKEIYEENQKKERLNACKNMLCCDFSVGSVCAKERCVSNCNGYKDFIEDVHKCKGYKKWNKLSDEVKKLVLLELKV